MADKNAPIEPSAVKNERGSLKSLRSKQSDAAVELARAERDILIKKVRYIRSAIEALEKSAPITDGDIQEAIDLHAKSTADLYSLLHDIIAFN